MSEIKYGLISQTDARTIEKTIDLIRGDNVPHLLNITEVGVYAGETMNGMREYVKSKEWEAYFTGIDNNRDGEKLRFEYDKLIVGNSNEVYNEIKNESQHLILVDGYHTFPGVVSDFFCYSPKVRVGGFLAFHDTGEHIDQLSGWQGVGDKNDPDMCLGGVRNALRKIGLIGKYMSFKVNLNEVATALWGEGDIDLYKQAMKKVGWVYEDEEMVYRLPGWELIFNEADETNDAGGFCVFRKLY